MADEIKQTGNIARVQPTNPSRGAGQRKRRPQPPRSDKDRQGPRPGDERSPHVDEYV